MTIKLAANDKIAGTSSKGNQEKWLEDEYWYKLDQFGYEALAEVMTSKLLEFSNIEKGTPFKFVRYEMQIIKLHGFFAKALFIDFIDLNNLSVHQHELTYHSSQANTNRRAYPYRRRSA